MKNKRYQLKPALILCGAMTALIIVIFVMAGNINRNVAKNMKGRLLYDEAADGGKSSVVMYDFTSEESARISEDAGFDDAFGGVFAGEHKTAFIARDGGRNGIYIYDSDKKSAETAAVSDSVGYLDLDYCASRESLVCLCRGGGKWWIEEIPADKEHSPADNGENAVFTSENEIRALCCSEEGDVYFVHDNGNGGGVLKVIKASRTETLYVSEKTELCGVDASNGAVLVCENGEKGRAVLQYNAKRSLLDRLKFNSDEYECAAPLAVSSTQFIVSADIRGSFEIYVCNGSNIVRAEKIVSERDMFVTDYASEQPEK
ncbi:MAG: hypothetical protein NC223_09225 [Butyrivibrio sp.]|nr:hypothetical protein [Butyrivibrio sp.]